MISLYRRVVINRMNKQILRLKDGPFVQNAITYSLSSSNKDNKKVSASQGTKDEDDEILNALNHFFNSKKMEETNRRKRK